jgi:hypothetical protein
MARFKEYWIAHTFSFLLTHLMKTNGNVNALKNYQNCVDLFKFNSKKDVSDENRGSSNKDNGKDNREENKEEDTSNSGEGKSNNEVDSFEAAGKIASNNKEEYWDEVVESQPLI